MTAKRGTSNSNKRGSSEQRRRRREYLVETYRADVDLITHYLRDPEGSLVQEVQGIAPADQWAEYDGDTEIKVEQVCRCYRCGALLTVNTVTVDRIKPGCQGGTYRRENIRPSCPGCMSRTRGKLGAAQRAKKRGKKKC